MGRHAAPDEPVFDIGTHPTSASSTRPSRITGGRAPPARGAVRRSCSPASSGVPRDRCGDRRTRDCRLVRRPVRRDAGQGEPAEPGGLDCPERSMPGFGGAVSTADRLPKAREADCAAMNAATRSARRTASRSASRRCRPWRSRCTAVTVRSTTCRSCAGRAARACGCRTTTCRRCTSSRATRCGRPTGRPIRVGGHLPRHVADPFQSADIPRYFCNWGDLIIRRAFIEHGVGPFLISDEATVARAAPDSIGRDLPTDAAGRHVGRGGRAGEPAGCRRRRRRSTAAGVTGRRGLERSRLRRARRRRRSTR